MKGKEGFGYFKGRKKNQKKCELAKKLRVGLIKNKSILKINKVEECIKILITYGSMALVLWKPSLLTEMHKDYSEADLIVGEPVPNTLHITY